MPLAFYVSDAIMLVLALAAAASAIPESRQRIFRRGWLLAPGLLAFGAAVGLFLYPDPFDLVMPELMTLGLLGFLAGIARGFFMHIQSDHAYGVVRLRNGDDAVWVSGLFALCAVMHFYVEMRLGKVSPFMASAALVMTLGSGYLLGRSIVAYARAVRKEHYDLRE